jgi:hypothetical protein
MVDLYPSENLNGESSDDTIARRGTAKLISLSAGLKFPFSVLPTTTWPLFTVFLSRWN